MLAVDARIAVLAAGQFGVVSRQQLLAQGMTARMINFRVSKRLLLPIHRGVYALPSVPLSWW
ncbi:MAG: type IV toxin-antitoxin system AbiEi family antitoxin domain-containing protein [Actinomycetota bacterium]